MTERDLTDSDLECVVGGKQQVPTIAKQTPTARPATFAAANPTPAVKPAAAPTRGCSGGVCFA